MQYIGENTTREFSVTKIEEIEKRLDGLKDKLNDGTRKLLKMTDADVRYTHTTDPTMFHSDERARKATEAGKFERQRVFLFSDMMVFAARKKLAGVSTRQMAFRGRIYVHEMRLRNAPPGADNRERTLTYMRQTVDGADNYTVVFGDASDKEEWWMGLDDVINHAKREMVFGLKLHELMTVNKTEIGRDVPTFLVRCIEFLNANGLGVEGIYRISGSSTDIEDARASFNKGVQCDFQPASDVHLVSGLLKLWLRDLREPLCTSGMFDEFVNSVTEDGEETPETIGKLTELIGMLPQYERFALHELMLHLAKVAAHSEENNMKADNLAIVIGPNVLKSPDLTQANVHQTFTRVFKVIQLMIENVETVFAGVAEQRVLLLETAKSEIEREKASLQKVLKETDVLDLHADKDIHVPVASLSSDVHASNEELLLKQWCAALMLCNHPYEKSEAALGAILARAHPSREEYSCIRAAITALTHSAVQGSSTRSVSGGHTQSKNSRSVGESDFTEDGSSSGIAFESSSPPPSEGDRSLRDSSSSNPVGSRNPRSRSSRNKTRLTRALSGGGAHNMPRAEAIAADWNVRAYAPAVPRSRPPALNDNSRTKSSHLSPRTRHANGEKSDTSGPTSPVAPPIPDDPYEASERRGSAQLAVDSEDLDESSDGGAPPLPPTSPPPSADSSSSASSSSRGTKPRRSKTQGDRRPACEQCHGSKAKHRILLDDGQKKMVCSACMEQFPSQVKKSGKSTRT